MKLSREKQLGLYEPLEALGEAALPLTPGGLRATFMFETLSKARRWISERKDLRGLSPEEKACLLKAQTDPAHKQKLEEYLF